MRKKYVLRKDSFDKKYRLCYAKPFEVLYSTITGSAGEEFYHSSYEKIKMLPQVVFDDLTVLESKVLVYRFGFLGEWYTLQQVGDILRLSKERIRQIESKAIGKLRHCYKRSQCFSKDSSHGNITKKNEEIMNAKEIIVSGIKNYLFDNRNENMIFKKVLGKNQIDIRINNHRSVHCIDDLEMSYRIYMCLKREGINTLEELTYRTIDEMKKFRNLGRKSLDELLELMESKGLFPLDVTFSETSKDNENKRFVEIEISLGEDLQTYKIINPTQNDVADCIYDILCNDEKYSYMIYDYNISVGLWNLLFLKGYIYAEKLIEDFEMVKSELGSGGFGEYIEELESFVTKMQMLINDKKMPMISFWFIDNMIAKQMIREKITTYGELRECLNASDENINKHYKELFDKKCVGCQIEIDLSEISRYEQYQKYIDKNISEAELKEEYFSDCEENFAERQADSDKSRNTYYKIRFIDTDNAKRVWLGRTRIGYSPKFIETSENSMVLIIEKSMINSDVLQDYIRERKYELYEVDLEGISVTKRIIRSEDDWDN